MKKIQIITAISALAIFQACQQPAPDAATVDAKVSEAYEAEKLKVENEAAMACDEAINARVKAIQDSMAAIAASKKLSAEQAAAALAKRQAALKAKAAADAKKKATAKKPTTSKPTTSAPVLDSKGNQVGTSTTRGDGVKEDKNIKLDDKGNQQGTSTTR